ncbi:Ycf66-like protein [Calothrix sp. NIES-4071]|nr:Ycf66-like protein [Calothrix sp. NIES-4071]BAZ63617.1 Ycf66-like protein [Calothrix sp. NIES-4105]
MLIFGLTSASVLAQVNVGATPATFLGIFLAVAGAALYFIRNVKPELSRDHDIFFAAVGLLCGFILIFQGWRLDPILQFGQLMLVGSTVFFAYESIRLRSIATEQAKRNTPIVDDERPVSKKYNYSRSARAERVEMDLEPLPYYEDEEYEDRPRIRGSSSERRQSRNYDEYPDESSRRTSRRSSNERNDLTSERPRRKTSRSEDRTSSRTDDDDWNSSSLSRSNNDDWDTKGSEERRTSRRPSSSERSEIRSDDVTPSRPRRRRPSSESSRQDNIDESIPTADYTDYVDYKPLEQPKEKPRPNKFDDDDVSMS